MKIAILDDYLRTARQAADWDSLGADAAITLFHEPLPAAPDQRAAALAGFDVIVAMRERTPFPADLLRRLPDLRLLITTGMRNRGIDMQACAAQGVLVCGAPGSKLAAHATAELAWAHILGLFKNLAAEDRAMHAGAWQTQMPRILAGKTLGIVGLGKLGQAAAAVGKAFGMEILAYSPHLTDERAAAGGARRVDKETLFAQSDVISMHLILSDSTRGLASAELLRSMKPDACFVNTSRAGLVDMDALYDVLRQKRIGGAGLDVFPDEPLPADDRLRSLDNVLLTPHLGYVSAENFQAFYRSAVQAIAAWAGGAPVNSLN
ncbi:D-2-hydroxyacid dehydrogenase family protein [Candidimonas nitroreducens]|uniref:Hydroxyacid dehydrogenase n=1 Tax=Candidimonas nitroreducens TaxID=683354 RepID=A0A225MH10_9BURK|nr:D-2-hydroxyacid dehydrogenase family protein [Candidimonas nitroreducens]OWT59220.1 hydroxyacid dehydrogenase [Candidimonas nitroreducens]